MKDIQFPFSRLTQDYIYSSTKKFPQRFIPFPISLWFLIKDFQTDLEFGAFGWVSKNSKMPREFTSLEHIN